MLRDFVVSRLPALGGPGPDLATALSAISDEFALDVLTEGGLAGDEHIAVAAANLRFLTGLLPEQARLGFLFTCWQEWSRVLAPAERIELSERARREAGALAELTDAALEAPGRRRAWQKYFDRLSSTLDALACEADAGGLGGSGVPVRYALFHHAHLTHGRLGITAGPEAVAARATRAALAAGELPPLPRTASTLV